MHLDTRQCSILEATLNRFAEASGEAPAGFDATRDEVEGILVRLHSERARAAAMEGWLARVADGLASHGIRADGHDLGRDFLAKCHAEGLSVDDAVADALLEIEFRDQQRQIDEERRSA